MLGIVACLAIAEAKADGHEGIKSELSLSIRVPIYLQGVPEKRGNKKARA